MRSTLLGPAVLLLLLGGCEGSAPAAREAVPPPLATSGSPVVTVFRSPYCSCCEGWIDHMKAEGFRLDEVHVDNVAAKRAELGIPPIAASCHTSVVDGYALEGHVPAADVHRLLGERPIARGLAVAGMPMGSPGMEGAVTQPYDTWLLLPDGSHQVFASH